MFLSSALVVIMLLSYRVQCLDHQGGKRQYQQPLYQDTQATLSNTYHTADCVSTGVFCSNEETCCTKTCKVAKGFSSRVCCLSEGDVCDSSSTGNPGLELCCAGLQCAPIKYDGKPTKVSACQVITADEEDRDEDEDY